MSSRLATQAGLLAASGAAGQLANATVAVILVRVMTQDEFGTFRQLYLILTTFVFISDLGFCESLYYFLPRRRGRNSAFLFRALLFTALAQLFLIVGLVGFRDAIGRFFNNPDLPQHLLLLASALGLTVITRLWEVQLISEERIRTAATITGGYEVFKVATIVVTITFLPTIEAVLWALVSSAVLKVVVFVLFLAREHHSPAGIFVGKDAAVQIRYALTMGLQAFFSFGASQAHQYIVSYSTTPSEFAIYSVACFQIPLVGTLVNSIRQVLLVKNTASFSTGDVDSVRSLWTTTCKYSLLIVVPVASYCAVVSEPLISLLFTRNYAAAVPLFVIMLAILPLNVVFTDNLLRAFGRVRNFTMFHVWRFALVLMIGIPATHYFGLWGAALSGVAALAIVKVGQLRVIARLLNTPVLSVLPWWELSKIAGAAALAAVPAFICAHLIESPPLALGVGFVSFFPAYVFAIVRFELITPENIRDVISSIRSKVFGTDETASDQ